MGYGSARYLTDYKILDINFEPTNGSYVWWDKVKYNIVATKEIRCYYEDVLRTHEIIKPEGWKGQNAEIFVFFKATYSSEPIGIQNGEDIRFKRAGQIFIGMDTYVDIWIASPLPIEEINEKNYFGNWSIKLEYTHHRVGDFNLEVAGALLISIGVALSVIPLVRRRMIERRMEKINYYAGTSSQNEKVRSKFL